MRTESISTPTHVMNDSKRGREKLPHIAAAQCYFRGSQTGHETVIQTSWRWKDERAVSQRGKHAIKSYLWKLSLFWGLSEVFFPHDFSSH